MIPGPTKLYLCPPQVGYLTDRLNPSTPRITLLLIIIASALTLSAYTYLCLPPGMTQTAWLGMIIYTLGYGMVTLLMVILVPKFLPPHLVPLGLGLHKSMEMASTSTSQTLAGLWLDHARVVQTGVSQVRAGAGLLRTYWFINILQLACAISLSRLEKRRRPSTDGQPSLGNAEEYEALPMASQDEEEDRDMEEEVRKPHPPVTGRHPDLGLSGALAKSGAERSRGKWFFIGSLAWVGVAWLVFLGTAWARL